MCVCGGGGVEDRRRGRRGGTEVGRVTEWSPRRSRRPGLMSSTFWWRDVNGP